MPPCFPPSRLVLPLLVMLFWSSCSCSCGVETALCLVFVDEQNTPTPVDKISVQVNGGETRVEYDRERCKRGDILRDFDRLCAKDYPTQYCIDGGPGIYTVVVEYQNKVTKKLLHINSDPIGEHLFVFPCDNVKETVRLTLQ